MFKIKCRDLNYLLQKQITRKYPIQVQFLAKYSSLRVKYSVRKKSDAEETKRFGNPNMLTKLCCTITILILTGQETSLTSSHCSWKWRRNKFTNGTGTRRKETEKRLNKQIARKICQRLRKIKIKSAYFSEKQLFASWYEIRR